VANLIDYTVDVTEAKKSCGREPRGLGVFQPFIVAGRNTVANTTAAGSGAITWTFPFNVRVIDAWVVKTVAGGASHTETFTVYDGSDNAISDSVDIHAATDTYIYRITTIDDAYHNVKAGTKLKAVFASADSSSARSQGIVYIRLIRVS
jgi:hypothetical protein